MQLEQIAPQIKKCGQTKQKCETNCLLIIVNLIYWLYFFFVSGLSFLLGENLWAFIFHSIFLYIFFYRLEKWFSMSHEINDAKPNEKHNQTFIKEHKNMNTRF